MSETTERTRSVSLTDTELVILDGRCRAEVQAVVDQAKARLAMGAKLAHLPANLAGFIADAVAEAEGEGRLTFQWKSIRSCALCGKDAGYAVHTRSGRYHRKGDTNYDKPRYLNGIEIARRFITIRGHAALGCCAECFNALKPALQETLADVRAEIPEMLLGRPSRFRRFSRARCTECGWEGHEGQMRQLLTWMGDGYYPGGCPKCPAINDFGVRKIETVDGFEVVEVAPPAPPSAPDIPTLAETPPPAKPEPVRRPAKVAQQLALAHHLQAAIDRGAIADRADVARKLGLTRARVTQLLDLLLLAPDLQAAVLAMEAVDGAEPMAERTLRAVAHAGTWAEQREAAREWSRSC